MTHKKTRDYEKEYKNYHSSPKQVKDRMARNRANYKMKKEGRIKKGDGKDVDHRDGNPHNNSSKNLRIVGKSKNRSRKRTA
jgi:hypothetical protein